MAEAINDGKLTVSAAAKLIGVSRKSMTRNRKKHSHGGEKAIKHGNCGRAPCNRVPETTRSAIYAYYKDNPDVGSWQQLAELLRRDGVASLSTKTVGRIMAEAGVKSPRTHKAPKRHLTRPPRLNNGELVQLDASRHKWFTWCDWASLHGIIDDTGRILALWFEENECLEGYLQAVRMMVNRHGVPLQAYTDRHTIFCSPKATPFSQEELAVNSVYDT